MVKENSPAWFVYIIEASNGSLYTGITKNVDRRFAEHADGKGAKFFNVSRKPLKVVYTEKAADRSAAQTREAGIKRLTRSEKLLLIKTQVDR